MAFGRKVKVELDTAEAEEKLDELEKRVEVMLTSIDERIRKAKQAGADLNRIVDKAAMEARRHHGRKS